MRTVILLSEHELGDLLRLLPSYTRGPKWKCPECGAFLRNGRAREQFCSPCEERNESAARDALEIERELPAFPDRRITEKVERLFWSKITRRKSGCWLWTGTLCNGTPELATHRNTFMARRVSYELHHGPLPRSVHVYPICKNRVCVNPEHLQAGGRSGGVA